MLQELVDRCAAISAKPNAIQSLVESMSKLSDICVGVETMLQEIKSHIEVCRVELTLKFTHSSPFSLSTF